MYKLYLLDMDGTLYIDNDLFDGVKDFLNFVKQDGGRYVFLTNNSSRGVDKYIEKLHGMGIETQRGDYLTSVDVTSDYLHTCNYKKIYVFGTESFKEQLRNDGHNITDRISDDVDCLVMGFDTELTFKKLEDACILLNRGAAYIATNPDWVCPTWYGYVPDCGSVAEMLYRATGKRPMFMGKPQKNIVELAVKKYGFKKEETVIIGDRVYTDIMCGKNAGIDSVLVLSGEGTVEDLKTYDVTPAYVKKDIKEFYDMIKKV